MIITWMTICEDMQRKVLRALTKDEVMAIRLKLAHDRQGSAHGMSLAPWRKWVFDGQPIREKFVDGTPNKIDFIPRRIP